MWRNGRLRYGHILLIRAGSWNFSTIECARFDEYFNGNSLNLQVLLEVDLNTVIFKTGLVFKNKIITKDTFNRINRMYGF